MKSPAAIDAASSNAPMQLREQLSENPAIPAAVCLALLGGCAAFVAWWFWPRPKPELQGMVYFYDLNTGDLLPVPADTIGPIETESGPYHGQPAGVRAYVFCCGKYKSGDELFVTLEAPAHAVPAEFRPGGAKDEDWLVRRKDEEKWYKADSRESKKIMQELRQRCPEDQPLDRLEPLPTEK